MGRIIRILFAVNLAACQRAFNLPFMLSKALCAVRFMVLPPGGV
jgi:hypothetical protein